MPTYVLVPESFVRNPKLLSLLCYFGPTHCFWLEALNSQIERGVVQKLQHLPPLNPGYATDVDTDSKIWEVAIEFCAKNRMIDCIQLTRTLIS